MKVLLVPLIVDGSVHLSLQLVGAPADGPPVTTGPLGARVLLEVLRNRSDERREFQPDNQHFKLRIQTLSTNWIINWICPII